MPKPWGYPRRLRTTAVLAACALLSSVLITAAQGTLAAAAAAPLPLPSYDASAVANPPATIGAGVVTESTRGGFSVSEAGSASYTVPLRVVPGRGGFQPDVSLSYSSEAGNSQLGVGFTLGGLSQITRCSKTVGMDAVSQGPRFDVNDRFCLDGLRLKAVGGLYGEDGTEYRTIPDTQRRVRSFRPAGTSAAGPATFAVESPDGVKHTFGPDGSTTHLLVAGAKVAAAWSVARSENRSGNLIRYNYETRTGVDGSEVERWIASIDYGDTGKLDRRVDFGYETRPDPTFGYQYGVRREGLKRLRAVTMSIDVGGFKQARKYELRYQNGGATGASKLDELFECGTGTDCRRATQFTWSPGTIGFGEGVAQKTASGQVLTPSSEVSQLVSADLNGDGRTDLAWPEENEWRYLAADAEAPMGPGSYSSMVPAGGTFGSKKQATAYPFDFDLDGKVDLVPRSIDLSDWRPFLSRQNLSTPQRIRTAYFGGLNDNRSGLGDSGGVFGDFNGDGYQDVLEYRRHELGGISWSWRRRSGQVGVLGDDSQNPENLAYSAMIPLPQLSTLDPEQVLVIDIDGDGREEIVYESLIDKTAVLDPNQPSAQFPITNPFPAPLLALDLKLMDLNGDGLSDVVSNGLGNNPGVDGREDRLYYRLNTGRGFTAPQLMGVDLKRDALAVSEIVDADGDGRQDLLVPRWTGVGGVPAYDAMELIRPGFSAAGAMTFTKSATEIQFSDRTAAALAIQGARRVDANGDGLDDIVLVDHSDLDDKPTDLVLYSRGGFSTEKKPDLLTRVREGNQFPVSGGPALPSTIHVTYTPLTDSAVYQPGGCGQKNFIACLGGTDRYVVKQVRRDPGLTDVESTVTESYFYRDGRFDKLFQEFLGFAERRVTTSIPGRDDDIIERSFYTNTTPQADPRLDERWVIRSLPGHKQAMERTRLGWGKKLTPGGSFFHYNSMTQERSYEFPTMCCLTSWSPAQFDAQGKTPVRQSIRSSNVIDIYGNVTTESERTGTGAAPDSTTSTTLVPDLDLTNWLVNRPKTITVTDQNTPLVVSPPPAQTRTQAYSYDPGHVRIKQHKAYGPSESAGEVLAVDYEYDASGNVNRVRAKDMTTGEVRESTSVTDPWGFPHATMNGAGQVSRVGYDPLLALPKVAIDVNGLRTDVTYDTLGRVRKVRTPSGAEQSTTYAIEQVGVENLPRITVTDGSGALRESVHDRLGRVKFARFKGFDGKVRQSESTYDGAGHLVQQTDPRTVGSASPVTKTTTTYDDTGRVRSRTTSDNQTTSWSYNGLETTQADARGNVRVSRTDHRGQTVRITEGSGSAKAATRTYGYGAFGTLRTSETEGLPASRTTLTYDDLGNLETSTDAERGTTTVAHNAFGEPVRNTDSLGRVTIVDYDLLGREKTATTTTNGTVTSVLTNVYDGDGAPGTSKGQLISTELADLTDGGTRTVKTGFTYDALHRRDSVTSTILSPQQESLTASFEYDAFGRTSHVRYPRLPGQSAGVKVAYDYAPSNGRLEKVRTTEPAAEASVLWTAKATDERDRLTTEETGDGVVTTSVFDAMNRATSITNRTNSTDAVPTALLQAENYTYDAVGNLETRARQNPAQPPVMETFTHDQLDRVSTVTTSFQNPGQPQTIALADSWDYDKLGNITTSKRRGTYTYDVKKPTQATSITGGIFGNRTYEYDALGRQTKRPTALITYNDLDLPSKITSTIGGAGTDFLYDGAGQRVRKSSITGTTTYLPGLYERHTTSTNTEHRLLVTTGGASSAVLRYTQAASASTVTKQPALFNHTDRLGSTSLVTANDAATGFKATTKENRSYDTYGLPRNPDWRTGDAGFTAGIANPTLDQGYTGHDDDRELGLVNMKGRIYDPTLAKFITPDPNIDGANPSQAFNRYSYVGNNPLRYTDPSGYSYCLGGILEFGCDGGSGNIFGNDHGGSGSPGRGVNYQIGKIHITRGQAGQAQPALNTAESVREEMARGVGVASICTADYPCHAPAPEPTCDNGYMSNGLGACADEVTIIGHTTVNDFGRMWCGPGVECGLSQQHDADRFFLRTLPDLMEGTVRLWWKSLEEVVNWMTPGPGLHGPGAVGMAIHRPNQATMIRAAQMRVPYGGPNPTLTAARSMRDQAVMRALTTLSKRQMPSVTTAGFDPRTGRIAVGFSSNPVGCAECDVQRQLGIPFKEIQFTEAIWTSKNEEFPICSICQSKSSPAQYPLGTNFYPSGPWGRWPWGAE